VTAPVPPPQQPPPPPPERPSVPQAEAVAQAQAEEISAALPALTAFVLAVMAYARAGGRIAGLPLTVASKVGYHAAVMGLLTAIATRALDHTRAWSGSRAAEELWEGQDIGVRSGIEAGLTTLAQAAKHIARNARIDEATGGSPGVSLPGEIYDPQAAEHAKSYADPEQIALPLIQSTRHAAQLAAATEAGWRRKTWVDMHDNRVRVNHAFLGSPSYEFHTVPMLEPFVTLDGNKLWYPGDTSAPPHEWMRCRCWLKLSR
jgi:hypothetical protein